MTIAISPLRKSHLRQVMATDSVVYPSHWSRKLWLAEIDRPGRIYLVAEDGGAVVGYIGAAIVADDLHIMTVVARPSSQRRGIATRLMIEVVSRAVAQGCTAMTLEVRAANKAAQALYRRFGMAPAGVRRGYYQAENEDAIVMWVQDIQDDPYADRLARIAVELEAAA